jgi:(p)ppGpp synthase/HD superfamily hydrolase
MTPAEAKLVSQALRYAVGAFADKMDKGGKPAILHSLRMGLAGTTAQEMAVGFLHDVVEDCGGRLEWLEGPDPRPCLR